MKIYLLILSILALLSGVIVLAVANSTVHEIEAFVLYIISAILMTGYAIVNAIHRLTEQLETKTT